MHTDYEAYSLGYCCRRFVINIPEEESRDPIRIFFQIELAHWFYLDFYCPENPKLRSCSIKEFSTQNILFENKEGISVADCLKIWRTFVMYMFLLISSHRQIVAAIYVPWIMLS
jgi:hypothetical protein